MEILLLVFALPTAVITFSIALQKILKCPSLVAGITFSVFLILTFVLNNLNLLIVTLIYTIISYITAILICIIHNKIHETTTVPIPSKNNCFCDPNDINDNVLLNNNHICEQTFNCINPNGIPTKINIIPNNNNYNCRNYRQKR